MSNLMVVRADYQKSEHASAIIALLDAYAQDSMGGGEALSAQTKGALIPTLAQRSDALSLLAYVGDNAVGLLNAFEGFSTFKAKALLNIHDLFVLAHYRQQGIGRELLQCAEVITKERHYCKVTLEVLRENHSAQHLYQSVGFAPYVLDASVGEALFYEKVL